MVGAGELIDSVLDIRPGGIGPPYLGGLARLVGFDSMFAMAIYPVIKHG